MYTLELIVHTTVAVRAEVSQFAGLFAKQDEAASKPPQAAPTRRKMTTAGDGDEPTIEDGSGSDDGVDWDAAAAAERAVPAPAAPAVPSSAASATPCFYPDAFHSALMMPTLPSCEITGPSDSLPIATVVYTMGAGIPVQAYPCEKGAAAAGGEYPLPLTGAAGPFPP